MAEYIEREATIKLLQSLGSRDYRREKGTIQEAIKMVSSEKYTPASDVEPVPRWISVKDRLPEGDDCDGVLVVVNGRCGNVTFDHAVELAEYDPVAGEWIITAYPEFENPGVTHWMPLPELPGEERA